MSEPLYEALPSYQVVVRDRKTMMTTNGPKPIERWNPFGYYATELEAFQAAHEAVRKGSPARVILNEDI